MFDLEKFISTNVIRRTYSMFIQDIDKHRKELQERIQNKSVLVIGGAGSIGSSFIKAILPFMPKKLVVVDINENALAELTRDLRSTYGIYLPDNYLTYPMDYGSAIFEKMLKNQAMQRVDGRAFDIVANFSAHKHVRSEKDIYSIEALLANNIFNAKKLLDLLVVYPPEVFFCVSTDKAANPVNIMGASKRIMEDIIFSYSNYFPVKTARFANVAFSNGSLLDGYLHRINKLQPLSGPSDVKRYFVSPEESGQICMLASILGGNREIFFPKLKDVQMEKFNQIAIDLLYEYGYEPLYCSSEIEALKKSVDLRRGSNRYPVFFSVSNTTGEKQYEEFYTVTENVDMNRFAALGVITGKEIPNKNNIEDLYDEMAMAFESTNVDKKYIVKIIQNYLPNFKHVEVGKNLDSKM